MPSLDAMRFRGVSAGWVLVALSPLAAVIGFAVGSRLLLPILCAAPAYAAMLVLLFTRTRSEAIAAMLLWAALHGAIMTVLCTARPERASAIIVHGPAYWQEMSLWVESGRGRESEPSRFLPQHLMHAAAFVGLSLATASALSIAFGGLLMNYMAYYVAHVGIETPSHPTLAAIIAWHPWSIVRIASYVILGVCFAEPLLTRLRGAPVDPQPVRPWVIAGLSGLALDVGLKLILAPHWPALLRSMR